MTERLYIYVKDWDKRQGRRDRPGLPWFRVYSDLQADDDWNELSTANRCLLLGLWSDTNRLGLGRVTANLRALRVRHACKRASLEPLIEAGFITLSTTKGAPTGHQNGGLEERRGTTSLRGEKNARESAAENGAPQRSEEELRAEIDEMARIADLAGFHPPEGFHP